MNPVAQAIKYAERSEHEGAGYTLLIREMNGAIVHASVFQKEGMPYLLRVLNPECNPDLLPDRADYFPSEIASVTVLW